MQDSTDDPLPASLTPLNVHPPFWRSERQELVIVRPLELLGYVALNHVARLPVGLPGRELWLSLTKREQSLWTPVVMIGW
jgi:hypothetical protein